MKNVLLLLVFFASLFSCKKDEVDKTVNDSFDTAQAILLSQGNFSSGAHATSGNVKLYSKNGSKFLVFDNFNTDSGPDLRVYLSKANIFYEAIIDFTTSYFLFYIIEPRSIQNRRSSIKIQTF